MTRDMKKNFLETVKDVTAAGLCLAGIVFACNENPDGIWWNVLGIVMLLAGGWIGGAFKRVSVGG